jgi:hypothetical protein
MVLGYGDGFTIFLKDHVQRQQAESLLHAMATNFQFVEPPSVIPRAAKSNAAQSRFVSKQRGGVDQSVAPSTTSNDSRLKAYSTTPWRRTSSLSNPQV